MSVSKPWKALERRAAKWMKGDRIWRQDFSEEKPDGESDRDVWDAKCYASFSVVGMWVKAFAKYRDFAGDRRFVLFLFSRAHPRAGDFVLVRARDYAELVEKERGFDSIAAELALLPRRTGRVIHGDAE